MCNVYPALKDRHDRWHDLVVDRWGKETRQKCNTCGWFASTTEKVGPEWHRKMSLYHISVVNPNNTN